MKIDDAVRERAKPIVALDDDELLALFKKHDAYFRQVHAMMKHCDTDLRDREMCAAWVEFRNRVDEAAMVTRACAELIRIRMRKKPNKQ